MKFNFKQWFRLIEQNKFEESLNYIHKFIPSKIYKYYWLFEENNDCAKIENDKRFQTLSENKIWLSDFEKFNDPFEAKNLYTDVKKLKEYGYENKDIKMINSLQNMIEKSYKMSSFSGHLRDCMPMWAHYANNYRGFCVEYKVNESKFIFPVFYEKIRNGSDIFLKMLYDLCKCGVNPTQEMQDKVLQEALLIQLSFCIKHKSWEYENEYRILILDANNLHTCEELHIQPTTIYAGLNTSSEHKKRLRDISNALKLDYKNKCVIDIKEYNLNFE